MFRLKVTSPVNLKIKFIIIFRKNLNRFRIRHMAKFRINHMVQSVQQPFINERIKEIHFLRCVFQNITNHKFQHLFCQIHIVIEICKCAFRLYHPEFCSMTGGIGIFSTESRSECIHISECLCICLTVKLSAYCQICFFSKEILTVIRRSLLICRYILHIQSCHLEHFPGTLTVRACNNRSVYIYKSFFLEKLMNGISTK